MLTYRIVVFFWLYKDVLSDMNFQTLLHSDEKSKIAAIAVSIVMLALTILQIISFFRNAHPVITTAQIGRKIPLLNIDKQAQLFTTPLFGNFVSPTHAIKKSTLQVQLVGIMHSVDSTKSQVLIRLADSQQQFYHNGDLIMRGATIKQIYADHVIILYNGSLERLVLPDEQLHFTKPLQPLLRE